MTTIEAIAARDERADYGVRDPAYQRFHDRSHLLKVATALAEALRGQRALHSRKFICHHCLLSNAALALFDTAEARPTGRKRV